MKTAVMSLRKLYFKSLYSFSFTNLFTTLKSLYQMPEITQNYNLNYVKKTLNKNNIYFILLLQNESQIDDCNRFCLL